MNMFRGLIVIYISSVAFSGCSEGPEYYGNSTMYWDQNSSTTILFSGGSESDYESVSNVSPELWNMKNEEWTKIAQFDNLPNPGEFAYDQKSNLLFFLSDNHPYRIFSWDGSVWEEISTGFPQDLTDWPSFFFNTIRERIEIYDFENQSFWYYEDAWKSGGRIEIPEGWSEMKTYAQISDPIKNRLLFAGCVTIGGNESNIVFEMRDGDIHLLDYIDERSYIHSFLYDESRNEYILFAGDLYSWNVFDIKDDRLDSVNCQHGPKLLDYILMYNPSYEGILVFGAYRQKFLRQKDIETWLLKYSGESNESIPKLVENERLPWSGQATCFCSLRLMSL